MLHASIFANLLYVLLTAGLQGGAAHAEGPVRISDRTSETPPPRFGGDWGAVEILIYKILSTLALIILGTLLKRNRNNR
jgi:hypothetical protein